MFMFDRNYMDYHKDRFRDHSLLFYRNDKLIALLPMSEDGRGLYSHGGLTYGGFITGFDMKQHIMNECFEALISYAKEKAMDSITYKCIPHIFHKQPAEEDRYSLYAYGGKLITIDASTYMDLDYPLKMLKGRKAQITRAKREGVVVREIDSAEDYIEFIRLENDVLAKRHNTKAVHTGEELKILHDRFADNIKLYGAFQKSEFIAGSVLFIYDSVVHTQYMAANDEARKIGGLDLIISTIIGEYRGKKKWLDFGISTEHDRLYLNEGLISQKESFGGRTGVYEKWKIVL